MSDATTKQSLLRAISVAEAHGFGLNIRVALDPAGRAVLLIEPLAVPGGCAERLPEDDGVEEARPPRRAA